MIPVDQTVLHAPEDRQYGNCHAACLASLLEILIEEIPSYVEEFEDDVKYWKACMDYLVTQGYWILLVNLPVFWSSWTGKGSEAYHIISGMSPRGFSHSVIGKEGEIVHDPHPDRAGLLSHEEHPWAFEFLIPTWNKNV